VRPPTRRALFRDERRRREEKGGEFEGANALALLVDAAAVDANMMISFFFCRFGEKVEAFRLFLDIRTLNTNVRQFPVKKARTRARERERCHSQRQRTIASDQSLFSLSLFLCDSVLRREKEFSSSR